MVEISVGALVLIISLIAFILPAGIFIGRLSQRVDSLEKGQSNFRHEVRQEFRDLKRYITFRDPIIPDAEPEDET